MVLYHKRYSRYIFMEGVMTKSATKTTMKRQSVHKTKMDKVYEDVKKFTKDKKVADKLIEKYGVECAYAIVRQSMQEPGNVAKRINSQAKIYKTGDVIKYFATAKLSDAEVAKGIKKTTQFVANSKKCKNTTPKAQASQKKVEEKTATPRTQTPKTKTSSSKGYKRSREKSETRKILSEQSSEAFKLPSDNTRVAQRNIPVNLNDTPEHQSSKESAEIIYNRLAGGNKGNVSIEDLLKYGGVKGMDIQNVFEENKEYFAQLQPGKTNKNLASRANRVSGKCEGGCLAGVQGMCPELGGQNPNWPKKEYKSSSNSACNAPEVLEKGGKYVVIEVENTAFGRGKDSAEEKQMKAFNKTLPGGTIAALDNYKTDDLQGRRPQNNSQKHGHIWVQDDKGAACSDGRQPDGPQFSRYGKTMFICVAKDCQVPKEIALELIKAAQERQQETQVAMLYTNKNQKGH